MSELLIEFFSEEIPSNLQISTRKQFQKLLEEKLFEANIKYKNFEVYSTPTRIVAHISELPDKIKILPAEIKGPKVGCLLYTSPSPRDRTRSRMPSSA